MLKRYFKKDHHFEAGVDEAGRGCLAGPVAAAAVILDPKKSHRWYKQLNDSKVLKENKRNELRKYIEEEALAWSVAFADHHEIDAINILNASFLAMHRAIESLVMKPSFLVIDGNRFKSYPGIQHVCMIKGDGKFLHIAAASILAKTHRDELMLKLHEEFPVYCWNQNKAYGTLLHRNAMEVYGLSPYHRLSFHCIDPKPDLVFSL